MKKAKYPPFANGTEYMIWEEHNCDRCIKSSRYNEKKQDYTKIRCAIQRDIFYSMGVAAIILNIVCCYINFGDVLHQLP